ncbi:hypothetical protein B6D29_03865 [Microgenomates bacterium UTCPR1]|nr:hypothetical protein [Patescibacteria group bacterium]OQY65471.1 MAG: hypothetical protein B6D29_03865 [Microgenomates bacterium UTCPR1]
MNNLADIEQKEYNYFNEIDFDLSHDLNKMITALNSKDKIKKDWIDSFKRVDKKRQNSDFARGAERVYFWLLNKFGTPNSSPIGADLMFEVWDAFVHIDIKTAKLSNKSDYKGKIPIGENQTSYKSTNFNSNLPFFYNIEKSNKSKICLTYIVNIIYDDKSDNFKVLAVILISVPNGKLKEVYKDKIIGAGKSKGRSFRYEYKENPYFQLIKEKPKRIKFLYIDPQCKEDYFSNIK